ncbi:Uncharacterized protein OBRU01_00074 [Operophtera brumata]|uniref:Uncharacterized protein n=1 Tax=Operophtera brumata TaxID=104452 RepID=A0A0L7LVP1_OPEBR|nr:Uncharacterized protein OBRU01_00074 [Operophtera brumata]
MSDSSSESELLTTKNLVTFQNESTIVSVKGHNINTTNLTGLSFQNNVFTSTLNRPWNNEWQRRAESNCGQRSIGYRRETSPMSVVSACDARQRNYSRWNDTRGMNSQRSVYNGRGGSPVSLRSVEACNQFYKHKTRKRIEKRRNLKMFLRGYLQKSGHDSGELASDSSISSDDNRTTRGSSHKDKSCCRSTKTDVSDLRKSIRCDNQLKDCTGNFKQSSMRSMIGGPANISQLNKSSVGSFRSTNKKPSSTNSMLPPQSRENTNQSSTTLSDRFKNGYSLPVERFNSSIAASTIPEGAAGKYSETNKHQNAKPSNTEHNVQHKSPQDLNSDDEEISSEIKTTERPANLRKRSVERDDNIGLPNHKRPKVASPSKNISKSLKNSTAIEKASNYYEFAKPAFPVRRSAANLKAKDIIKARPAEMNSTDKLISKSRTLLSDNLMQPPSLPAKKLNPITQPNKVEDIAEPSVISQNTTDASMRQSFIKRKLFTQNMDVTEKTNEIFDGSSPEKSIYDAIQKDKKKTRKLVTSQCCLSRAIEPEGSVILNLINKFVSDDIMNATTQSNKTVQSKLEDNDDKWDVSTIIATRNNDENVSDTFTDEDTLDADNRKLKPSPKAMENKSDETSNKIVEILPPKVTKVIQKVLVEKTGTPNKTVQKSVKTFWDTDFESEAEGTPTTRRDDFKENHRTDNIGQNAASQVKLQGPSSMFSANKTPASNTTIMNNTVDSIHRFNNTNSSFRLYTHRNNKLQKLAPEKYKEPAKSHIEPQSTTTKATSIDLSMQENNAEHSNKAKIQEKPKHSNKKSPAKHTHRNNKPKKLAPKNYEEPVKSHIEPQSKTTKATSIDLSMQENNTKHTNKAEIQEKPKHSNKKSPAKHTHRNNKPKKLAPKKYEEPVKSHIEPQSKTTKATSLDISMQENNTKHTNKAKIQEKPKHSNKKSPAKQEKPNKETRKETQKLSVIEQIQKQNSKDKILKRDQTKTQNGKTTETVQNEQRDNKEPNAGQNKPQNSKKTGSTQNNAQAKKGAKVNQNETQNNNKTETNNKPQNNLNSVSSTTNTKQTTNTKAKKTDTAQLETANNNKKSNQNATSNNSNGSKMSDSIVYEDSITETNKSLRPVRSSRISKQNATLQTSKANTTLSMTLRSSSRSSDVNLSKLSNEEKNKTPRKNSKIKFIKSAASFSLQHGKLAVSKPVANNYYLRLCENKDIDSSDVSFTLANDKESPNRRNTTSSRNNLKTMKHAGINLTPVGEHALLRKNTSRRNRLPNLRYVS